jgi:uncharacterized protein YbjT (DUF2867 family)
MAEHQGIEVAIAGAHGNVARRLARLLVAEGDAVRGLIRNPDHADDLRADGSEPVLCDLETATPEDVAAAVRGVDVVVFAAGAGPGSGAERKLSVDRDGAVKLLAGATIANVERYLIVSSTGAEDPPDDDEVFSVYLRAKAEADRAVMESDRAWTVVRPVSLNDDAGAGKVELSAEPITGEVSRGDVAALLAAIVHEPRAARRLLYVRGGDDPIPDALATLLA